MVQVVRHIERGLRGIQGDTVGLVEARRFQVAIDEADRIAARQRDDRTVRADLADAVIVAVGHVDSAGAFHRNGDGFVELGSLGRAVGKAGLTRSRHGSYRAIGPEHPYLMVAPIGEEQAALLGVRQTMGPVHTGR